MSVVAQKPYAKTVDRPEKCAIEGRDNIERNARFQDFLSRAPLHFVRCAVGERNYDQPGQPLEGARAACDLHDAIGDGARFSGAGRSEHGEIGLKFAAKTFALRAIERRDHGSSSDWVAKAGCVNAHFASRTS